MCVIEDATNVLSDPEKRKQLFEQLGIPCPDVDEEVKVVD